MIYKLKYSFRNLAGKKDDLEGLAHVYIYLMKGGLPWQNLKANNKK
jgi:hypothetical protein